MALTTFDVFVDVLQDLGALNVTSATGADSKTAIISSYVLDEEYDDDEWNGGYMFVIRTSDGLAPQGEYMRITDFVGSTGTFTTSSFTANVSSGDIIGFTNDEYSIQLMLERLNSALRSEKIGDLVLVDTSITTVTGQTEYTLPVTLKRKPFRVEFQSSTTSGDYEYLQLYGWQYVPATAGAAGKLVLADDPDAASRILRVWYIGRHPTLSTYSSVIHEDIPPEVARYALMVEMMNWQNAREKGENAYVKEEWNKYSNLLEESIARWNKSFSKRRANGIILTDAETEDEFYPIP